MPQPPKKKPRTASEPAHHEAYPVKTVARLTGLSPDLIRAWERRYNVVSPQRGPRGARLYSGADVAHLRLLGSLVTGGRSIGDVAGLQTDALRRLANLPSVEEVSTSTAPSSTDQELLNQLISAVQQFDSPAVERLLGDSLLALGVNQFISRIGVPLLHRIGDLWRGGEMPIAGEHVASSIIRNLFGGLIRLRAPRRRPAVLLTSPAGERHELGLSMVALLCMQADLAVAYAGVDLPAEEILSAQKTTQVAVVGLSIVTSTNRTNAVDQIRRLEAALPREVEIWLGGSDAAEAARALGDTRAIVLQSLPAIEHELARIAARVHNAVSRPSFAPS